MASNLIPSCRKHKTKIFFLCFSCNKYFLSHSKYFSIIFFSTNENIFSTFKYFHNIFLQGNTKRTMRRRPATAGTQFKISLGALLSSLSARATCHYVRCIKPNETRSARVFDMALVQHQVRYLGWVNFHLLWRDTIFSPLLDILRVLIFSGWWS